MDLEEAVSRAGVGRFQNSLLVIFSVLLATDAAEMSLLSFVGPTLRCQWDLTIAQTTALTTAVFVGLLCGALMWGIAADRFGRRSTLRALVTGTLVCSLASAGAPTYATLLGCRVAVGIMLGGFGVGFGYLVEWMPSDQRSNYAILLMTTWTIGVVAECALGLVLLVKTDQSWRLLVAASSLPLVVPIIAACVCIPESPRWLLSKGRVAEARDALNFAQRINGVQCEDDTWLIATSPPQHPKDSATSACAPKHRGILTAICVIWFACSFVYYGLVLLTSRLGIAERDFACFAGGRTHATPFKSSDFTNIIASSVAEFPGAAAAAIGSERFGRRTTLGVAFGMCCVCLFVFGMFRVDVFLWGARACANCAFVIAWLYTQELFPTSIRSTAFGISNSCSRMGGVAASIASTTSTRQATMVFTCASAIACCVSFVCMERETRGKPMTED